MKRVRKKASKENELKSFEEILLAIDKIEIDLNDILENYRRKRDGEITYLKEVFSNKKGEDLKQKKIKEVGKRIVFEVNRLKVKPKKGKGKDLLKIEKLLEDFLGKLVAE